MDSDETNVVQTMGDGRWKGVLEFRGPLFGVFIEIFLYCLVVAANLLLIFAILDRQDLCRKQNKWLLMNMAECLLVEAVLYVTNRYDIHPYIGTQLSKIMDTLCAVFPLIQEFGILITPSSVALVTVERFISIWRHSGSEPGFSKIAVIISVLCCNIVCALTVYFVNFHLVGGYSGYIQDGLGCDLFTSQASVAVFITSHALFIMITVILTVLIIAKWCHTKSKKISEITLPLVVANICFLLLDLPRFMTIVTHQFGTPYVYNSGMQYLWHVSLGYAILVPLIWLSLSPDICRSYIDSCCPCCPCCKEEERELITLHYTESGENIKSDRDRANQEQIHLASDVLSGAIVSDALESLPIL